MHSIDSFVKPYKISYDYHMNQCQQSTLPTPKNETTQVVLQQNQLVILELGCTTCFN